MKTQIAIIIAALAAWAAVAAQPLTRPAAPGERLAEVLYPPTTQRATTAPAIKMGKPILPAPDAHPRPRLVKLPPATQPAKRIMELLELVSAAPIQAPPKLMARPKIAMPTAPFPPLVLPQPPMPGRGGAGAAATAMIPSVTSDSGPGQFPLMKPLVRTDEVPIPDAEMLMLETDPGPTTRPVAPDDDPPIRPTTFPARPAMEKR